MALSWLVALLVVSLHPQFSTAEISPLQHQVRNGSLNRLTYPEEQYHDEHDLLPRTGVTALWQDDGGFPLIKFAFADAYVNRFAVWRAVIQWQKYTCLKFREVSPTYSGPHLRIQRHADDCKSYVGVISSSGQDFYISEDCERHQGDLLHELGYAIGLWPTESRTDRDSYVQILEANSLPDVSANFPVVAESDGSVPYDYCSIMHHHGRIFTSNGKFTIATLNPLYQGVIGQRLKISHMDYLRVNKMYQCSDKLLSQCSLASDPCQNYGILNKLCSCTCPDGTTGTNCETVETPYEETYLSPFSEVISSPTTLTSPADMLFPTEVKFTKVIVAPACHRVVAQFTNFDIYQRTLHYVDETTTQNICWYDALNIQIDDSLDGEWYCGEELQGQTMTSIDNQMILYFKSNLNFMPGWSADIAFEEMPGCMSTVTSSTMDTNDDCYCFSSTTSTTTTSTSTSTSTSTTSTSTSTSTSTTSTSTSTSTTTTSTSTSTSTTTTSTTTSTSTSTSTTTTSTSTSTTTTTTSTSTSTSTTTSTTTTTSTSTSTSTSTTSTSTSSTTTTTTGDPCFADQTGLDIVFMSSINYPDNYAVNLVCEAGPPSTTELGYAWLTVTEDLAIAADDILSIQNPYSEDLELQGTIPAGTKFLIPSLAYVATFTSDSALTDFGFNVEFNAVQPRCSKDLIATVDRQSFTSPRYPLNGPPPGTICEYRIQAEDPSQRVKLIMYRFSVNEPSYFRINLSGDKLFSESTVVREVSPASATYYISEGDVLRIFFYGEANTRGFKLRYKMVP